MHIRNSLVIDILGGLLKLWQLIDNSAKLTQVIHKHIYMYVQSIFNSIYTHLHLHGHTSSMSHRKSHGVRTGGKLFHKELVDIPQRNDFDWKNGFLFRLLEHEKVVSTHIVIPQKGSVYRKI